jgi:DNA polymerase III subunit epsilon
MIGLDYFICDTETTGLKSKGMFHEICEMTFIRVSNQENLFVEVKAENPRNASYDALKITGRSLKDLERGVSRGEAVGKVSEFLSGNEPSGVCIVGHNLAFDRRFLHALWEDCNQKFPANLWLDTMDMVKHFIKKSDVSTLNITKTATGRPSTTLTACCEMLGVKKFPGAHSSQVDTGNTYWLWKKLSEIGIDHLPFIKTHKHLFDGEEAVKDMIDFDPNEDIE